MSARPRSRWWRVIDWRVVAAAGVPVWAAVIGFVAWDKARAKARPAASPVVAASLPAPVAPVEAAPPPKELPAPPPVVVVPVVMHQPAPPAPRRNVPFWLRDDDSAEDGGDQPRRSPELEADGCQTFDTAVRFVPSPTEAMRRARQEDKLVYVLHLAGNLEDEGFT